MIKRFFSMSLLALAALAAQAYEIGEFAYSKVAKYQITGKNLVVNGKFTDGATGFDLGWKAIDEALPLEATFTMLTGGPNGSNIQQVLAGQTALTSGMYQKIDISEGGTYVVSFKVMGAVAGFTDIDLTGGNTNYMNAYYNTDGVLATVSGTDLYYGTNAHTTDSYGSVGNGICGGYQFSFTDTGFTEAVFAVNATADGNIIIDFRGLQEGVQIADVECHLAEEVYDDRIARNRMEYFGKFLTNSNSDATKWEFYADLVDVMNVVNEALEANASPVEMELFMMDLENVWAEFVAVNFDDAMSFIPTIDGSSATGNNSANWMNWTGKYNKLNSNYNGKAPWSWNTDRWCHKTVTANSPMAIQWMRGAGANSNWYNIATLTTTLAPGTYYWGVSGQGGMMTLNKNRWARSWANECAETWLFFNGDTIPIGLLNAARNEDYVVEFKLEEEKEVTLGIICNNVSTLSENCGFDVQFYSPILYKVKDGGLTMEEQTYLDNVAQKLAGLENVLAVAYEYAGNYMMPWGLEALEAGIAEIQARYDGWAALSQDEMLEMLYNDVVLSEVIENEGILALNENYVNPFIAINVPLTDMPSAIEMAWEAYGKRIYASSSKMAELENVIVETENLYWEMLGNAYSEANATAMIEQKAKLEAMVEAFKQAVNAVTLADIDFNGAFVVEKVDTMTLESYYAVEGTKGEMRLPSYANGATGTTMFEFGYNGRDSLNMLRVGNGEAVVDLGKVNAEIVNIKFDLYYGNLSSKMYGYKVLDGVGEIICGLFCSTYSGTDQLNTFGVDYNKYVSRVGSSSASNAAIAAATNKTSFDIVLDYGIGKMYCTTSSAKGTVTTEEIDLAANAPRQFVLYSDYTNADRRSWFDNLKILNIGTSVVQPEPEYNTANVLNVQDTEVFKGSAFTFPVSMTNENGICAFQCDVYLSDGLMLNLNDEGEYDVVLNANRKTSTHSVATSLQPDGAIRVIAYSSSNKLFRGNSGELFTLNLTALEGYAEDQTIEIRNIRLSTADEYEYLSAPISAAVTVKSYTPADANGDGQITIVDVVAVVNALMGTATGNFIFDAADMDQNGQITIVDVVAVVNALMGNNAQTLGARSILRSNLHVTDAEVNAGESTTLYVKLDNAQAYTAMQMDMNLPEGLTIEGVEMVGDASHTVTYNEEGRIAAYSLGNSRFHGGEALMAITVKADDSFTGAANVGFTNVRVVSTDVVETVLADALSTVIGGAKSIDGVEADENVQILYYSTTGAVSDAPHKGLNIIKRIWQDGRVEVSKEMKK